MCRELKGLGLNSSVDLKKKRKKRNTLSEANQDHQNFLLTRVVIT